MSNNSAYEVITNKVIESLEKGVVPWRQPWGYKVPMNFKSKRPYHGINFLLLAMEPYACPYWATFRQINDANGTVKRGEHGTQVAFWKMLSYSSEETMKEETFPFLRYYTVFNLEQTTIPIPEPENDFEPVAMAEKIVAEMPKPQHITFTLAGEATYNVRSDLVTMPPRDTFDGPDYFYSTLFHELTHSTGHVSRLCRFEAGVEMRFGNDLYSEEELVAEIGSCFLRSESGIEGAFDNSASYINSWLSRLKDNRQILVRAASRAEKAVNFILNRQPEKAKNEGVE